ncbi:hypothetical protein M9H77_12977 [Catharanthus roseus]|uniref:Uncharacterized protein n=1 Tax=Catharanthus roseus TaxID=4058 RepID=A0ACC0BJ36_CATRO|nr:hypothetical protein M9H77_12977 [Catharanthus roseus]
MSIQSTGTPSPLMTQAPPIPASMEALLHLAFTSQPTPSLTPLMIAWPTYYLRIVYLIVVRSCGSRDGSFDSGYGSSGLEASIWRFLRVIIFAYKQQKDLTKRFYRSKYLEELHKHQKGEKKGEYADFYSARKIFTRSKGRPRRILRLAMFNDLQLMAIVAGGMSRDRFYRVGSETAHLIAESSRVTVALVPCYFDHKQRLMRRVEDAISKVSATFDEYMR